MNRFFVEHKRMTRNGFTITGSDVHHMAKVLRLRPGDRIVVVTPAGQEWEARLDRLENNLAAGTLLRDIPVSREARLALTLIQGLPKGGKMDDIIQDGTEIGIVSFIPLISDRSVVRLDSGQGSGKVERWQKIAAEAAKQARRTVVPTVAAPVGWDEVWESKEEDCLDIVLWEGEERVSLKDIWQDASPVHRVRLLVGPEGGFTEEEVARAVAEGVRTATLGPRILRTETAGLVAAAVLLFASGDLGGS